MPVEQNIRVLSAFPGDYAGEYVVRFGSVALPGELVAARVHDLPAPDADSAASITAGPLDLLSGVIFLVDRDDAGLDMKAVTAVQKEYLYRYYKTVILPQGSPFAPAVEGVRRQPAPEIVRTINRLRNLPCALRYPLTRKLEDAALGKPVLLLLPGPSLSALGPVLPQLARSHIVVAVSRTVDFSLKHGVQPDFVVQLDTYLIQRRFFDAMPSLPETTLVALSISPVYGYAHKFKGLLFMDSFDLSVLKNPHRLRENGLSTLMACMGLAECLHAPYAVLAGVDLSFPGSSTAGQYFNGHASPCDTVAPECIETRGGLFFMANRSGRGVYTNLNYLAVAREAERFAGEIAMNTGTRFLVCGDQGILGSDHFPAVDPGELCAAPGVDREALSRVVDSVLEQGEDIDLTRLKIDCAKTAKALDQNLLFLEACRVRQSCEGLENNPIYLFACQERDFRLPDDRESRLAFAVRIARVWRRALDQAHNLVQGHIVARHGGEVTVICLPEETERVASGLTRVFPGFNWCIRPVLGPVEPRPMERGIVYHELQQALAAMRLAFVTPAARAAYDYQFDVYGANNLYYLEPFTTE